LVLINRSAKSKPAVPSGTDGDRVGDATFRRNPLARRIGRVFAVAEGQAGMNQVETLQVFGPEISS
jgi:hypothetical protein